MSRGGYIWITRWEDFQHYPPSRDRPPAWIKDYVKQLDDERYLRLTDRQRSLIRDLRDIFATMHGYLPDDARMIGRRRSVHTRDADLIALNHAGLIEFVSREAVENRLEKLYSSRARAQKEKEMETGSTDLAAVAKGPGASASNTKTDDPDPFALLAGRVRDVDRGSVTSWRRAAADLPAEWACARAFESLEHLRANGRVRNEAAYVTATLWQLRSELSGADPVGEDDEPS